MLSWRRWPGGPPCRGVVFDVDGTLADTEPLSAATWAETLRPFGVQPTSADHRAVLGLSFEATRDHFARTVPGLPTADQLWPTYSQALLRRIGEGVQPYPDALAVVIALLQRRVPVAVASASPRERLAATLDALGLRALARCSVAGDDVEHPKPAPDVFLAAASLLGIPAVECLAVEDSGPGVASARAAGMTVIAVRRDPRSTFGKVDLVVDTLRPEDVWRFVNAPRA